MKYAIAVQKHAPQRRCHFHLQVPRFTTSRILLAFQNGAPTPRSVSSFGPIKTLTVLFVLGLAHTIVSACSIIDFSAVLVDGWLPVTIRDQIVTAIGRQLERQNLTGVSRPDVLPGTVGADARVLGAASLPLSARFLVEPNA